MQYGTFVRAALMLGARNRPLHRMVADGVTESAAAETCRNISISRA